MPDFHVFPEGNGMAWTPMEDADVQAIARAHGRTPAQVLLQWQYGLGIPTNPRSQNVQHMADNLAAYDFTLSADEMRMLGGKPQDLCRKDPSFYECANNTSASAAHAVRGHSSSIIINKLISLFN